MSFDPAAVETPAAPHPHPTPSAMYCDTRVVTLLCLALFWPACPWSPSRWSRTMSKSQTPPQVPQHHAGLSRLLCSVPGQSIPPQGY